MLTFWRATFPVRFATLAIFPTGLDILTALKKSAKPLKPTEAPPKPSTAWPLTSKLMGSTSPKISSPLASFSKWIQRPRSSAATARPTRCSRAITASHTSCPKKLHSSRVTTLNKHIQTYEAINSPHIPQELHRGRRRLELASAIMVPSRRSQRRYPYRSDRHPQPGGESHQCFQKDEGRSSGRALRCGQQHS